LPVDRGLAPVNRDRRGRFVELSVLSDRLAFGNRRWVDASAALFGARCF